MPVRNPCGDPPRLCPRSRGVLWYGQRWYIRDACDAAGINENTFYARRRDGMAVHEALTTPASKGPRRAGSKPRPPTSAELVALVEKLAARVEQLEWKLAIARAA